MSRRSDSPSRRRVVVVMAVVALLALVAGAFLVRAARGTTSRIDRTETKQSTAPAPKIAGGLVGPGGGVTGMSVESAAGKQGAAAAGVAYATAPQRWLYFTDEQIKAALSEIATPAAAPRLTREVTSNVSAARNQLSRSLGRVWWLVRPLAWRVDDFRDRTARVSVWTVTILSAAGVAAPQTEFGTVTLDLELMDGAWRVDAAHNTPGPTPITGPHDQPWDAEPFDEALDAFTRMGEPVP